MNLSWRLLAVSLGYLSLIELFPTQTQAEKSQKSRLNLSITLSAHGFYTPQSFKNQVDIKVCGAERRPLSLIVSKEGFLQNAVAFLEPIPLRRIDPPHAEGERVEPPEVKIAHCEFQPRIVIMHPGTRLGFQSNDPILFQIRSQTKLNGRKLVALPPNLLRAFVQYDQREIITLTDDLHPWMKMHAIVDDLNYIKTSDENGRIVFKDIEHGTYRLWFWHESLGTYQWESTLDLNRNTSLKFDWKPDSTN